MARGVARAGSAVAGRSFPRAPRAGADPATPGPPPADVPAPGPPPVGAETRGAESAQGAAPSKVSEPEGGRPRDSAACRARARSFRAPRELGEDARFFMPPPQQESCPLAPPAALRAPTMQQALAHQWRGGDPPNPRPRTQPAPEATRASPAARHSARWSTKRASQALLSSDRRPTPRRSYAACSPHLSHPCKNPPTNSPPAPKSHNALDGKQLQSLHSTLPH